MSQEISSRIQNNRHAINLLNTVQSRLQVWPPQQVTMSPQQVTMSLLLSQLLLYVSLNSNDKYLMSTTARLFSHTSFLKDKILSYSPHC